MQKAINLYAVKENTDLILTGTANLPIIQKTVKCKGKEEKKMFSFRKHGVVSWSLQKRINKIQGDFKGIHPTHGKKNKNKSPKCCHGKMKGSTMLPSSMLAFL